MVWIISSIVSLRPQYLFHLWSTFIFLHVWPLKSLIHWFCSVRNSQSPGTSAATADLTSFSRSLTNVLCQNFTLRRSRFADIKRLLYLLVWRNWRNWNDAEWRLTSTNSEDRLSFTDSVLTFFFNGELESNLVWSRKDNTRKKERKSQRLKVKCCDVSQLRKSKGGTILKFSSFFSRVHQLCISGQTPRGRSYSNKMKEKSLFLFLTLFQSWARLDDMGGQIWPRGHQLETTDVGQIKNIKTVKSLCMTASHLISTTVSALWPWLTLADLGDQPLPSSPPLSSDHHMWVLPLRFLGF